MLRLALFLCLSIAVCPVSSFALERLGRGLVALECERGVFLSWRFLATDPENVRFHIFRRDEKTRLVEVDERAAEGHQLHRHQS